MIDLPPDFRASLNLVKSAFLMFNLYDRDGAIVGNTATYVQNLAPGVPWRFRAVAAQQFAEARLVEVRVFDN